LFWKSFDSPLIVSEHLTFEVFAFIVATLSTSFAMIFLSLSYLSSFMLPKGKRYKKLLVKLFYTLGIIFVVVTTFGYSSSLIAKIKLPFNYFSLVLLWFSGLSLVSIFGFLYINRKDND